MPPVPADTAVALGALLSHGGKVSARGIFLTVWLANVTSAALVYLMARRYGRPFFKGRLGRRLLSQKYMTRLERLYQSYGSGGIFISRFVPGVRAVVPPFAGIAGVGWAKALIPLAVASGIWYGTLTYVAVLAIGGLDDVVALVSRFNRTGLGIAALVVAAVGVTIIVRKATARR